MIIRQTTTIVFEYPQDYLQEQEWCKTKEDRWIHKGTDTLGAVYENQISYSIGVSADRKTENSSEKPNNCETCKWGEWYRQGYDITMMDDECGGCCSWNSKWTPKTEPNLSEKPNGSDEPQTERSE